MRTKAIEDGKVTIEAQDATGRKNQMSESGGEIENKISIQLDISPEKPVSPEWFAYSLAMQYRSYQWNF